MILLINAFLSTAAYGQVDNSTEISERENNAMVGRWIKNGPAIKEYPVCYQIWSCESSKPIIGESISLPKGEWGLCENYTNLSNNNVCTKCDAPPPTEICE